MGPLKRLTRRRSEPTVDIDVRSQAHPMPPESVVPAPEPPQALPRPELVPVMASHPASAEEQPYDRLDCPACGTIFQELPDAEAACPACGATIVVRICPEGVHHLLTTADIESFDDDWDAIHAMRRREEARRRNAAALQARRAALASYIELGISHIEMRTAAGACPACVAAAAGPYRARSAPALPIAGCERDVCRCVYAPARPSASRH
jgi:DNA-directed RNA polymerase subunit RPC12/RpoP